MEAFAILDRHVGMGWTTAYHTANPVPVMAIGVGAERFNGMNNNIDLPAKIRAIVGIAR